MTDPDAAASEWDPQHGQFRDKVVAIDFIAEAGKLMLESSTSVSEVTGLATGSEASLMAWCSPRSRSSLWSRCLIVGCCGRRTLDLVHRVVGVHLLHD